MKEIKKYLESRIGKYSFFFEDLKSGYVYGYNENVPMIAAGCMKLPIAVSLNNIPIRYNIVPTTNTFPTFDNS